MVFGLQGGGEEGDGIGQWVGFIKQGKKRGCSFDYFYRATSTDIMSDLSSVRVEFASYSSSRTASNVFVI